MSIGGLCQRLRHRVRPWLRWILLGRSTLADIELTAEQLFERYYRHESAQRIRGSGLGLALSRSVCALLGARISCTVRAGHIQFEVTFEKP